MNWKWHNAFFLLFRFEKRPGGNKVLVFFYTEQTSFLANKWQNSVSAMFCALALFFHPALPAIFVSRVVCFGIHVLLSENPTPAVSLPVSMTMQACAFILNWIRLCSETKSGALLFNFWSLRCHFVSPLWMVLYDYATIYLLQANACTERCSLHFWAWRESIACLRTYIQENTDNFREWNLCGICSSIDMSPHPPLQTLKNWHVLKVTEDKEQFVTDRLRSNLMGRPLGGWTFGVMKRGGRWGREQNGLAVRCNLPFSLSNSSLLG